MRRRSPLAAGDQLPGGPSHCGAQDVALTGHSSSKCLENQGQTVWHGSCTRLEACRLAPWAAAIQMSRPQRFQPIARGVLHK